MNVNAEKAIQSTNVQPAPTPLDKQKAKVSKWVWLVAAFALLVLAISVFYQTSTLPAMSLCFFKTQTGFPCPGCGLTRAFCSISHGDLSAAWQFNPFGFLFYSFAVFLMLRPFFLTLFPSWIPRDEKFWYSHKFFWSSIFVMVSMMIFGFARLYLLMTAG